MTRKQNTAKQINWKALMEEQSDFLRPSSRRSFSKCWKRRRAGRAGLDPCQAEFAGYSILRREKRWLGAVSWSRMTGGLPHRWH